MSIWQPPIEYWREVLNRIDVRRKFLSFDDLDEESIWSWEEHLNSLEMYARLCLQLAQRESL